MTIDQHEEFNCKLSLPTILGILIPEEACVWDKGSSLHKNIIVLFIGLEILTPAIEGMGWIIGGKQSNCQWIRELHPGDSYLVAACPCSR